MSLFLDPDEERICLPHGQSYHPMSYASAPSAHAAHHGHDVFDAGITWAAVWNPATEANCVSQPMTWPSQIGFRCPPTQTPAQPMLVDSTIGPFDNTATTVSWQPSTSEVFAPSTTQHLNTRQDSMPHDGYPQSAFLPSQPMSTWNSLQDDVPSFRPVYEMSPGRSEYSASSQNSAVASSSSPCSHSERCFPAGNSPAIKIEEDYNHNGPRLYSISNNTSPRMQYVHVNLGDVCNTPREIDADRQPATPPRMVKVEEDLKPVLRPRPTSRYSETSMEEGIQRAAAADDRNKRSYTTPMNAVCSCELCGKLFQRTSNLKAHMETHRPDREQPWACHYYGCTRRFVRKTDMARHQQSVHIKSRNFRCSLCFNSFSRKDTLHRHIEDGCSRRADYKKTTGRGRRIASGSSNSSSSSK